MNDDKTILICKSYEQLSIEEAFETHSIVEECDRCGGHIWVVPRNLILREVENAEVICWKCAEGLTGCFFPAKPHVDEIERRNAKDATGS